MDGNRKPGTAQKRRNEKRMPSNSNGTTPCQVYACFPKERAWCIRSPPLLFDIAQSHRIYRIFQDHIGDQISEHKAESPERNTNSFPCTYPQEISLESNRNCTHSSAGKRAKAGGGSLIKPPEVTIYSRISSSKSGIHASCR
jgi:hypothetical protein